MWTVPDALVVGGAECWPEDLAAIEERIGGAWPGLIFATNETATVLPLLDHFCTLHPEKLTRWRAERADRGLPAEYVAWSIHKPHLADRIHRGWTNGSSGLYAVSVALYLGCPRVILAGVPMDARPNHFRDEDGWKQFKRYQRGWKTHLDEMRGRVFSESGWTRDLLGRWEPNAEAA